MAEANPMLQVPCPRCIAKVGEWCMTSTGSIFRSGGSERVLHRARQKLYWTEVGMKETTR